MNVWYRGSLRAIPLHKATQKGDSVEVAALLAQGADVNALDAEGRTPLHHAVMRGHLQIVDILLEKGGPALLLSKDILGCTPVHLAAVQNQVTLIRRLVTALLKDEGGTTPLHEVARRQCMQDFMGFLHLGWDIAAREDASDHMWSDCGPAWLEVAKHIDLTRPGMAAVIRTMGWQPLHLAAMEGKVSLVRILVKQLGCNTLGRSANSWTPMHYAAAHNQIAVLDALAQLGCDPCGKDSVSSTPMHVAAGEGHIEAILKLVSLGADPGAKDRDGCTPLYCAAAWNRPTAVRKLHELGCPSWVRSEEGRTPVHVAAEQGWVALIDLLIRELRNKVDSRDAYQFTPLHSAANGGHVGTIQKLIHFSHDVDVRDYLGRTPLHYAALHGRAAAVEELVKQGAAHGARDNKGGYTPLHLAADAGQCEVISRLLELGADLEAVSTKGWTPLALANMKGPANVDAIGLLVELGADLWSVMKDADMETPLHMASRSGRLDIVQKLLRCGADHSKKTKDGSTPLHYAAAFGQTHVLETLVKAGIAVDNRDDARNTPLHLAAGCGFLDTVTQLIKLGADVNARDLTQCTPLQNAAHGTYSALATMPLNGSQGVASGGAHNNRCTTGSPNALHQQHLTPAQQATQAAITAPATHQDGKLPVRTGLAWAALAGHTQASTASVHPDIHSDPTADYRNLGLLQLLKKASRRRGGGNLPSSNSNTQHAHPYSQTSQDSTPLGRAQSSLHAYAGSKSDIDASKELGYEALLKQTEALQLNSMEQDRARLIPVAERLVKLSADVAARDMEGRTALHLAAGCGDKNMVVRLVALGTHVNCKDSVGGTPMHHAAMANKKEMMFTLARLGCDWRARAEGIDGATAAFVLCGQHTRTTRQQLVEAKLKRAYQEGQAARAAGQDPLAAELAASTHRLRAKAATLAAPVPHVLQEDTAPVQNPAPSQAAAELAGGQEQQAAAAVKAVSASGTTEQELSVAQADANMAALLQEEAGKLTDIAKKKAKRKKKNGRTSLSGDGTPRTFHDSSALDDIDTELSNTPKSAFESDIDADSAADHPSDHGLERMTHNHLTAHSEDGGSQSSYATDRRKAAATAHHSRASSATADAESQSSAAELAFDSAGQEAVRAALEAAVTQANSAIEVGVAAGDDVLQRVLDELDAAIQNAVENAVSAKYSKKVRKRLQQLLHEAVNLSAGCGGDEAAAAAASVAAAKVVTPKQEWQTAGPKQHKPNTAKTASTLGGADSARQQHQQGQGQGQGQMPRQGHDEHATNQPLQASGVVGPPPPPPPRQPLPPPLSQPVPHGSQNKAQALGGQAMQAPATLAHIRTKSGNAWGVPAKHRSSNQLQVQSPVSSSAATPQASSGSRHGATTITDPVQMMWQQQQIQAAPSNPLPTPSQAPQGPIGMPQLWPVPAQPTAHDKAVASPSQQQQQQQHQQNSVRKSHQRSSSQQGQSQQQHASFQPFAHSLLPQLHTSRIQPPPTTALTSAETLATPSQSHQSNHCGAQPPAADQHPPSSAKYQVGGSLPFQQGNAVQQEEQQQPAGTDSEALSTFHLPEGLAEQLSTSQPLQAAPATTQLANSAPAGATQPQQHDQQQLPQQLPQQHPQQLPLPGAAAQSQRKPKLRSPPGFSRPLDGAAKPFTPQQSISSTTATSSSNSSRPEVQSAAWPRSMLHEQHVKLPTSMTGGQNHSHAMLHPNGSAPGQRYGTTGQKVTQHANLATGQWALASNGHGAEHVLSGPFNQPPVSVGVHSNMLQWQIPKQQTLHPTLQHDVDATPCVLDADQHETSGLAPNDVLDFLGIGSDDQLNSAGSQSLSEQRYSQPLLPNGDAGQAVWSNK